MIDWAIIATIMALVLIILTPGKRHALVSAAIFSCYLVAALMSASIDWLGLAFVLIATACIFIYRHGDHQKS